MSTYVETIKFGWKLGPFSGLTSPLLVVFIASGTSTFDIARALSRLNRDMFWIRTGLARCSLDFLPIRLCICRIHRGLQLWHLLPRLEHPIDGLVDQFSLEWLCNVIDLQRRISRTFWRALYNKHTVSIPSLPPSCTVRVFLCWHILEYAIGKQCPTLQSTATTTRFTESVRGVKLTILISRLGLSSFRFVSCGDGLHMDLTHLRDRKLVHDNHQEIFFHYDSQVVERKSSD